MRSNPREDPLSCSSGVPPRKSDSGRIRYCVCSAVWAPLAMTRPTRRGFGCRARLGIDLYPVTVAATTEEGCSR